MKFGVSADYLLGIDKSHPARGGWIEMLITGWAYVLSRSSHPARGGWIEIYINKI